MSPCNILQTAGITRVWHRKVLDKHRGLVVNGASSANFLPGESLAGLISAVGNAAEVIICPIYNVKLNRKVLISNGSPFR
jgi:hypothetical protein